MKTITIDGNNIKDSTDLSLEVWKNFTKDLDWLDLNKKPNGLNLDSVNDFAFGGFGVFDPGEKIRINIINSIQLKNVLGIEATNNERSKYKYEKWLVDVDNKYSTDTLFYNFIDVLLNNGHSVVLE